MEEFSKAWDEDMYAFETEAKDMLSKRQDVCESAGRAYWDHRMKLYVCTVWVRGPPPVG